MDPPGRWKTWMQLLRAPNLLTVPGDPAAGFLLALPSAATASSWAGLAAVAPAVMCFYAAGLLLNDVLDLKRDRLERPARPLPSGRESARLALGVAGLLLLTGVILCGLGGPATRDMGLLLAAIIVLYDAGAKQAPFLGPLLMGSCRVLSLLLGASAQAAPGDWSPLVWVAAASLGIYVFTVTQLARREMEPGPVGRAKSWPAGALAGTLVVFTAVMVRVGAGGSGLCLAPWLAAICVAFRVAVLLAGARRHEHEVPAAVGILLRALLLLQAAFAWAAGAPGWVLGGVLLALWPISGILGRRFAMS